MLKLLNKLATQVDKTLSKVFANQYVSTTLILLLVIYAGVVAPNLPFGVVALFDNPLFNLFVLFSILVIFNYDPTVALLAAVGFVLSLQALNHYKVFGFVSNFLQSRLGLGSEGEMVKPEVENVSSAVEEAAPIGVASSYLDSVGAPIEGGGGEGESETAADFDAYGFMGSRKPQPQSVDPVLPPQPEVPEQVAAVLNSNCQHQGPQGMEQPVGFSGLEYGATL